MPNKKYAEEWLRLADQHYNAAKALDDSNESKNIIGIEIQQAIEKYLKAVLAYHKDKIPRTHDLIEIYEHINKYIKLNEDENDFLDI